MNEKTLSNVGGALRSLNGVNAMPAPTWHWLKMDSAKIELPDDLALAENAVSIEPAAGSEGIVLSGSDAFDAVMRTMDNAYAARVRLTAPGDAAERARLATGEVEPLDVPELSEYQKGALEAEEELSCSEAFLTGCGPEAYSYLRKCAQKPILIDVPTCTQASALLRVNGKTGFSAVAAVDVVVRQGATLNLTLALDGVDAAENAKATGLIGSAMRVFAGADAHVNIQSFQTASDGYIAIDDTGIFADEKARVEVKHTVLGAKASYVGLAADLRGDEARIDVVTKYLGTRKQLRDFNYQIRHLGRKTISNMDANGVLAGSSKKILRGTIDLMHGAKGAEGSERESVLLADEGVDNKTVPVILCDEDDVAGNHGATIGHVRPDQLFYLGCRGLSEEAAEALFLSAKLEEALLLVDDERIRASIERLGVEAGVPYFVEEESI